LRPMNSVRLAVKLNSSASVAKNAERPGNSVFMWLWAVSIRSSASYQVTTRCCALLLESPSTHSMNCVADILRTLSETFFSSRRATRTGSDSGTNTVICCSSPKLT